MKLKNTIRYIFAEDENFSLEHRLLISAIVIGILISLFGAGSNALLSSSVVAAVLPLILSILLFLMYYVVRFKKIFRPFVLPIIVIAIVGISVIWVFNGGINGSNNMPAFVILVLSLVIVTDNLKKFVIAFFIAINIIIYLIQLYRPDLITNFPTETERWIDNILTLIYSSFFIFLIIRFVHKNYTQERQKAEENERQFRALSENSQDCIVRYNRERKLIYINKAGIQMSGLSADKLLGKSIIESGMYSKERCEICDADIENVFVTKWSDFDQFSCDSPNGVIYLDWRLFPELNDKNEVVSVLAVSRDITYLKLAELKLIELNADKDRYMSILAHDLKGPFSAILGLSQFLMENIDNSSKETIKEQVAYINTISKQTYNLLEDLLLWSKSQSGKLSFEPKNVNLPAVCREIIANLNLNATAKNISIDFFSDVEIHLNADENMLKTILRNLLSNAVKYSNEYGRIIVATKKEPSNVLVTISDNGVGIDANNLPKLWQIAANFSTPGTKNETGTGLGLILCKEFITMHGGDIWVESELGKGSVFRFTIPI